MTAFGTDDKQQTTRFDLAKATLASEDNSSLVIAAGEAAPPPLPDHWGLCAEIRARLTANVAQ